MVTQVLPYQRIFLNQFGLAYDPISLYNQVAFIQKSGNTHLAKLPFWSKLGDTVVQSVNTSVDSLDAQTAQETLRPIGLNFIHTREKVTLLGLFLDQFKSPIALIFIAATSISVFLQDWKDVIIILLIVMGSALLSSFQEFNANTVSEKL